VDHATILPSRRYTLRDVTGHALGIKALDEADMARFSPILDKGVPLPSCLPKTFRLSEEGATEALIEVYQGDDGQDLEDCLKLAEFELTGLPPIYGKPHKVEIELRIDANGMLTATAYDTEGGKKADLQIAYKKMAA
jgi:molecular chaperone DnaK (HSP70)